MLFDGLVFNATFNNISVILWQSFLLVEETGVTRENKPPTCHKSNYHMIMTTTVPEYTYKPFMKKITIHGY